MANTVQIIVSVQDRASSALSGITGALGNMASVAGGIIAADVIGRIGEGFASVAMSGFGFNRAVENAAATLNAFTKDSEVSAGILEQLRIEAAKTPFAFEDMANAGAALLPVANQLDTDLMGLVQTAEILAAVNPAEGLAGAAFALKEAASGDFTSIIERFNLSRSAINALKEEGVPNMEIVARAMQDMGLDMDLVGNLATTFDGRMSTLKDTIVTAAGVFTQPIFDFLSEQIFGLQGTLDENMPIIEERLRNAGQLVADTFQTIVEAWNGEWVDDEVIHPLHRLAGTLTQDVHHGWQLFSDAITTVQQAWNGEWVDNDVIHPLHRLAGVLTGAVKGALDFVTDAWNQLSKSGEAWNGLLEAGGRLWDALIGYVRTVGELFGISAGEGDKNNKALKDAQPLATTLTQIFRELTIVIDAIITGINTATLRLQAFINWVGNAIAAWNSFLAAQQGQVYASGIPVGGSNEPSPPPNYIPPDNKSMIGGGMGRGMAGAPVVMNVYSQIDYEEAAYRIARIMQDNR